MNWFELVHTVGILSIPISVVLLMVVFLLRRRKPIITKIVGWLLFLAGLLILWQLWPLLRGYRLGTLPVLTFEEGIMHYTPTEIIEYKIPYWTAIGSLLFIVGGIWLGIAKHRKPKNTTCPNCHLATNPEHCFCINCGKKLT